ncbi:MAG: pyridoxamine 5-phosphate oxidase [Nitrospinaceae bacterium]|nr:pyridoxamine 5-phosphate oxidase [Nitrospinaceae bacterium]NIR56276.1 pyridoxamine 5-phosphate oxidase [Nitrospinaceae bacterium]NIS86733.1 pyridoxamine 5-phosphate oxidase [Nitrospinaceae bacterium]NIT83565.1 pyridoxamine 5-phosphate oxidase [Nitrospinaceae bacterium]NIU45770.1 pyridoxamine 5-phosphate oxidase [Nitrospinaceae bacterium]
METPGSEGEQKLQKELGTARRARSFYRQQMLDYLNPAMKKFIARQSMVFIGTSDGRGECDCSFRAGLPGFVHVLDNKTLVYPEYRGNGVLASLGNIRENPHIGMMFIDFFESTMGLHVNGKAGILSQEELLSKKKLKESLKRETKISGGRKPECWVWVEVEEAYIHCSKHIPHLKDLNKEINWGTDRKADKGGDFFKTRDGRRPWSQF